MSWSYFARLAFVLSQQMIPAAEGDDPWLLVKPGRTGPGCLWFLALAKLPKNGKQNVPFFSASLGRSAEHRQVRASNGRSVIFLLVVGDIGLEPTTSRV